MSSEINDKPNVIEKIKAIIENSKAYFKGVKSEWGKITWPQRQQVWAETIVVLVVVTFFTVLVYLIDIGFKWLFHFFKLS